MTHMQTQSQYYPGIKPADAMPKVLAANPGLEQHPPRLPEGLTLLAISPPEPAAGIELWS